MQNLESASASSSPLIEAPCGDLTAWMECFHNNEVVSKPYTIPPITTGKVAVSSRPYSIALGVELKSEDGSDHGPSIAVAHVGVLEPLIALPATPGMIAWAANTLIGTPPGYVATSTMTADGFVRWCEEPGAPRLHTCNHCDGTLLEPDEKPEEDGRRMVCQHCDGSGLEGDISRGEAKVGPVTVNRYDLRRVYKHLRGDMTFAYAPSLDRPGSYDAHVRAVNGLWRIVMASCR